MLRRSRADWPVVLASWVLLVSALSLLAAGTLYTDAVTLAGLHREIATAAPADRAVVVATRILPDRLAAADEAVRPELEAALQPVGGEIVRVLRSGPYAPASADPETVTDLLVLGSFSGIDGHGSLVDGRWAEPGRDPVEATLSEAAAAVLGVSSGDRLSLVSRLDAGRRVEVLVTGTWRPDPADPWWLDEPLALQGSSSSGRFTTRGPLVVAEADLTAGPLAEALDAQWRAIPDLDGFRADNLDAVAGVMRGLAGRINAALPASNQATVATKLPDILGSIDRSVLVTQTGILLLLIQFAVLAGYSIVLVSALLLERRRTETALLRARGAGAGHLSAMSLAEALLVAVPAVIVAPWVAAALVAAVGLNPAMAGVGLEPPMPGQTTFAVAALGGVVAVVVLVLPVVTSNLGIAGVRAALGRQVGRTLPQRVGLDLALVILAAIALLQLRLYGAPLTANARGVLGADPLLVAAPAIGLLGGAVLAVRILPRAAELAEPVLARGRGLLGALGGRQLARRPLRYTRAALLLILAAALGTFASAHAATWIQSQADQAAYESGADLRLTPAVQAGPPGWAVGGAIRSLAGVTGATPVLRTGVDIGAAVRDGKVVAVDAASLAPLLRLRDDPSGAATLDGLARLAAARPAAPGIEVPAGTRRLAVVASSSLEPVEGFEGIPEGYRGLTAAVIAADADGRVWRLSSEAGPLVAEGARLVIPLEAPEGGAGAAVAEPLRILAVELRPGLAGLDETVVRGSVDLDGIVASDDASGEAWSPVPLDGAGPGRWTREEGGVSSRYRPPEATPDRITLDQLSAADRSAYRLSFTPEDAPALAALASPAFLEATGAGPGDRLQASIFGVPLQVDLLASVPSFPTLDPEAPFLIVDGLALDLARLAVGATLGETDEWWLGAAPGSEAGVARALLEQPVEARAVVSRAALEGDLEGDPLGLGVIGILGLGSTVALVFAAVGFLVSATVSTAERLGELALLKAIGMSPRQIVVWLSMESVLLLVVGVVAGVLLGLVLAWLALPFATLTASGAPPVPEPVVVIPPGSLVPIVVLSGVLVVATVLLIRRQLPAARTSAVLRARDE